MLSPKTRRPDVKSKIVGKRQSKDMGKAGMSLLGVQKSHSTLAARYGLKPTKWLPTLKWERARTFWVKLREYSTYLREPAGKKNKSGPYGMVDISADICVCGQRTSKQDGLVSFTHFLNPLPSQCLSTSQALEGSWISADRVEVDKKLIISRFLLPQKMVVLKCPLSYCPAC